MNYPIWGTMLEAYRKLHPKLKSITELKEELLAAMLSWPWLDKLAVVGPGLGLEPQVLVPGLGLEG